MSRRKQTFGPDMLAVPRHLVAKELGRRVSRGEYERMFSEHLAVLVTVLSTSKGNTPGKSCITKVMHTLCPKWIRKHSDTIDQQHSRRARYDKDNTQMEGGLTAQRVTDTVRKPRGDIRTRPEFRPDEGVRVPRYDNFRQEMASGRSSARFPVADETLPEAQVHEADNR